MADAFDMMLVHAVFRDELHAIPALIRGVPPGEVKRSAVVGDHVTFMLAALHHHHMAEDDLLWWKLRDRAPASAPVIDRMENAPLGHRGSRRRGSPVTATLGHRSRSRFG